MISPASTSPLLPDSLVWQEIFGRAPYLQSPSLGCSATGQPTSTPRSSFWRPAPIATASNTCSAHSYATCVSCAARLRTSCPTPS